MKKIKDYKKFVLEYSPFKWEVFTNEKLDYYNNKHSFEIAYIRFQKVFEFLVDLKTEMNNPKIIDVGAYPGNMIKLSKNIFEEYRNYLAIGLDLDKKFIDEVKKFNVKCVDTEIDPNFYRAREVKEWEAKDYDICYLLDVIEHLVNPIHCLEKINHSLRVGGKLIITTDNITNFLYIFKMILKGDSPNVHPVLSSLFYHGNHRPHNKEFSKNELEFLLNYCGFKVKKHKYFDRKQGEFKIVNNKIIHRNIENSFKGYLGLILKSVSYLIPHFRNHQILVAEKVENINDMNRIEPTTSKEEWMKLRLKTIGY